MQLSLFPNQQTILKDNSRYNPRYFQHKTSISNHTELGTNMCWLIQEPSFVPRIAQRKKGAITYTIKHTNDHCYPVSLILILMYSSNSEEWQLKVKNNARNILCKMHLHNVNHQVVILRGRANTLTQVWTHGHSVISHLKKRKRAV